MMTILHTEWSGGFGGQELRILAEAEGLRKRGHRVEIACQPDSPLEKWAKKLGIVTHCIRMRNRFDAPAIAKFLKLLCQQKVEIISTHSYVDSYLASVAARLLPKIGIVRTRHLNIPNSDRLIYKLPHRIITTSESIREQILKERACSHQKIISIPTGVDLDRFNPTAYDGKRFRQELGFSEATPLVGSVAFLRKMKGHTYFLWAAAKVLKEIPDAKFLVVGSGFPGREQELKALAVDVGIADHVIFTGYRSDIPEILSALDVFVLPSIYYEGVPQAVLQAFAMGKPVVSTRFCERFCEETKEQVAIWVPPQDPEALAQGILKLLHNSEEGLKMGEKARKLVEERFTLDRMVDRMEAEYVRLKASIGKPKCLPKESLA